MTDAVPKSWTVVPLDDVLARIEAGASFRCEERPPGEGETGVVKVSAVTWGTYDEDESKTVLAADRIDERLLVRPGDFLFSRANTISLVGACVIARRVSRRVMLSDKILRLHVVGAEPEYVLHFLRSPSGRSEIERLSTGNQESMRNIGQDRIRAIRLPLAPLPEQRRIIAALEEYLSDLDAAVAGLERARANTRRYRDAVRASAVASMGDECVRTIGECAAPEQNAITDGPFGSKLKTEHYRETGPRVIRLQNIGDGEFIDAHAHISAEHFETLRKHQVYAGDVVIAALGERLPRACVIPDWLGPAIVKADCIRFKPDAHVLLPAYANIALNAEPTRKRTTASVHGVGRPRLNLSEIKAIRIPVPSVEVQRECVADIEPRLTAADHTVADIDVQLARAARLRQAILQRAFSGRLVTPDPADEPAVAFLDRIRAATTPGPTATPGPRGRPRATPSR